MTNKELELRNIPITEDLIQKWQNIVDILGNIINIPAALIMKVEQPYIRIFRSSKTKDNPYKVGDKELLYGSGLYCETVIKSKEKLLVPNALKDINWDKNPEIKLGMISYLGFPLFWPGGRIYGTICVLDVKENYYSNDFEELILQFKGLIEAHLELLYQKYELEKSLIERKKVKKALRASERELAAIYDHAPLIMVLVDNERRVRRANKLALEFANRSEDEIIGLRGGEALRCLNSLDDPRGCGFGTVCQTCNVRNTVLDTFDSEKGINNINASLPFNFNDKRVELELLVSTVPIKISGELLVLVTINDITELKKAEESLKRIEWLLKPKLIQSETYTPLYGDLVELNNKGDILNLVGKNILTEIIYDYLDLLETSAAVYEKNGDYALGIFTSGWCRFLDNASRNLCNTKNNIKALNSGKWLCHESCWTDVSKMSIAKGVPVDIECFGGIHIYAAPIFAGNEIIGSINFGYGDPPRDLPTLNEIAERYKISVDELIKYSNSYESRPLFIINIAKKRLLSSAVLIGEIINRKKIEQELKKSENKYHNAYNRVNFLKDLFTHDINNILQVILSGIELSELFLANPEDLGELKELMENLEDEIKRGSNLVSNVRKFSQLEENQIPIKKVEILSLLKAIIQRINGATQKRRINVKIDSIIKMINVQANEFLEDVFENIMINAIRYNENSSVEIIIKISKEQREGINYIKMEFLDNGIGIDDNRKKTIFLRESSKDKSIHGMGLGLSLVKKIVNIFNGKIWVEDKVKGDYSKGSNFILLIPEVI